MPAQVRTMEAPLIIENSSDTVRAQVIRTWSGMDGQMPDHIPVLGPSSTTLQLVHAFGFSGHGFQLGPVIGLIIAELVTKGEAASPIAPFAIKRFSRAAKD
jgi:sarcosine oxidase, subunit beta